MKPAFNVLILGHQGSRHIGTVDDHIAAFKRYGSHRVTVVDSVSAAQMQLDLGRFDAVVFHYSLVVSSPSYVPPALAARLAAFPGLKTIYIQDEMRWVDRTAAAIRDLGIQVVFSVVNPDVRERIYHHEWLRQVRFETTLTGFVPERLLSHPVPPYADRPVDVAYRARKLPAWLGSFAQEKWLIGHKVQTDAARFGLKCDISSNEGDRLYGDDWIRFLTNAKAVLGTESGASFIDYTGQVYQAVDDYAATHPDATFAELAERFLEGRDGDTVIHVISPRCFEAAALRTLMIMYPGEYSGILEAGRHYVALAEDHSNMDEVVAILRDPARAGVIIDNAYREIACSDRWTFRAAVQHFESVLDEEMRKLVGAGLKAAPPIDAAKIQAIEARAEQVARWRTRKLKMAIWLSQVSAALYRAISATLPAPLSKPVLSFCRCTKQWMSPLLRRILFG